MRIPKTNCDKCNKKLIWESNYFSGHVDAVYISELTGEKVTRNRLDSILIATCCGFDYLHEK